VLIVFSIYIYIYMAVGYPVIERWSVDDFFLYIYMADGYPVIERWKVDQFFLYMYSCYISSDRQIES